MIRNVFTFSNLLLEQRQTVADAHQDGFFLNHHATFFRAMCPTPKRTGWIAERTVLVEGGTCL